MLNYDNDPLAWLLEPLASSGFLSSVLERQHVVVRGTRPDRFRALLSFEQLDTILGTYGLRFPDVKLVKLDQDVPRSSYVWKDNLVDPMRVARLFAEGATVIVDAIQDRHEAVRRLCSRLSEQASARTQANVYLTPPRSQGFQPHWDSHDVFILQVQGHKHWRIYQGGKALPLASERFEPGTDTAGEVTEEFTLGAGDALYIPRGLMHAASAGDDVSLHITLGMIAYTWGDLLVDSVRELADRDSRWRENVPFGFGREEGSAFSGVRSQLAERLAGVQQAFDVVGVLSGRIEQLGAAHRPRVADHLRQAIAASAIGEDQIVEKRAGLSSRVVAHEDRVMVTSGEREVSFPVSAQRTLESLLQGGAVTLSAVEDDLDWAGRKLVVETLIREGILAKQV